MIASYRDKLTRDFAAGKRVKAFSGIERAARLKLDRLEAATVLSDLASLPGNRFEALKGDREGQYSVRINDQLRVAHRITRATQCRNRGLSLRGKK
jgi:toxin HigB-1